jgi:hypothetical protein
MLEGLAERAGRPLKISQLLRRRKKFKLSRMFKYASILNFFCFATWNFLSGLPYTTFSTDS